MYPILKSFTIVSFLYGIDLGVSQWSTLIVLAKSVSMSSFISFEDNMVVNLKTYELNTNC